MENNISPTKPHIIIFVEGDTDELLFRAILNHYKLLSASPLCQCSICNLRGVTRYSSKLLAKLSNEYLPEAKKKHFTIKTICCSYDTDVFEERNLLTIDWKSLSKRVKRLGIDSFIRIEVSRSIEDWILEDIDGICKFLKLKNIPKNIKGDNGNDKLSYLYAKAGRTYQKGNATKALIESLDLSLIVNKRKEALKDLEEALGVK